MTQQELGTVRTDVPSRLVETGELGRVGFGYYLGAAVMIAGSLVELARGVNAERRSLEDIATPLSVEQTRTPAADQEPA